ncbi:hypothetical protein [Polymorphospora lycopeni]|uniref:SGNH hydrolase-type esterase domain-containing protein n=1 Tax=Polymorphospora lycopeni TaxID=3140240 RepID=A0ABV5CQF0_9ACTN
MRIGIWERRAGGDRYERIAGDWPNWSDSEGFSRNPDRRRVVLLGESVARGLFYEPTVTPAKLLRSALDTAAPGAAEVVDLARSGARFQDILDLADAARDLSPDAVIVFAGNNWKYELTEWVAAERLDGDARALGRDGIAGVLRRREAALADAVRDFVTRLCRLFDGSASMIFVLPESNLLDWHPQPLAPVLGGDRDLAWCRLMGETRARADSGDWDRVLEHCDALHELDGAVSDQPFRYRAAAHLARGERAKALADFRRARDVRLWCDGIDPSWLPSTGVAAARRAAVAAGADVVDLTRLLPAHAASGIPDRSLFADFCHLNGRGLVVSVAEIACAVGPRIGLPVDRQRCPGPGDVPPRVEAGAAFAAAFVNSDFAQPAEIMNFHARRAAEADPDVVSAMESYCTAPAIPVPWWMRPQDVPGFGNAERFLRGIGRVGRYLYDDDLVASFTAQVNARRARDGAAPLPPRVDGALVAGTRTDLLDPIYAPAWRPLDWEGLLGTLPGRPTGYRHYFRAHSERSRFTCVVADAVPVDIDLTLRLGSPGTGTATILFNDREVDRVELTRRWRRVRRRIPPEHVTSGRNELEIRWSRTALGTMPVPVLAQRITQGLGQELSVVYGEVHSIHASPAPAGPPR